MQHNERRAPWAATFSGFVSGLCGVFVVYPLDTVKVRLQTTPHLYSGVANCFVKIARYEGVCPLVFQHDWSALTLNENAYYSLCCQVPGFYRGILSPLSGYGMTNALTFGVYSEAGNWIRRRNALHHAELKLKPGDVLYNCWFKMEYVVIISEQNIDSRLPDCKFTCTYQLASLYQVVRALRLALVNPLRRASSPASPLVWFALQSKELKFFARSV